MLPKWANVEQESDAASDSLFMQSTAKVISQQYTSHEITSKSFPQWRSANAEIKVPSGVRTQSLNILPLEPGVGQYIVVQATLTAMDFFLANF